MNPAKTSSTNKSLLSYLLLDPIWNTLLVSIVPMDIAPNLLTCLAFSSVFLNTILFFSFTDTFNAANELPNWFYYSSAVGLILYQTLDALDGKQARRTGTCSPVGQFMNHCFDALSVSCGAILIISALGLQSSFFWSIAFWLISIVCFYVSVWEEYYTRSLSFGFISGPSEGILIVVAVLVLSGIYGPQLWNSQVDISFLSLSVQWNQLLLICLSLSTVVMILYSIIVTLIHSGVVTPLLNLFPIVAFVFLTISLLLKNTLWYSNHLPQFILMSGIASANIVSKVILASITCDDFPLWNLNLFIYSLLLSGIPDYFDIPDKIQLNFGLIIVTAIHCHYLISVIKQMSYYLNIKIFTIKQ